MPPSDYLDILGPAALDIDECRGILTLCEKILGLDSSVRFDPAHIFSNPQSDMQENGKQCNLLLQELNVTLPQNPGIVFPNDDMDQTPKYDYHQYCMECIDSLKAIMKAQCHAIKYTYAWILRCIIELTLNICTMVDDLDFHEYELVCSNDDIKYSLVVFAYHMCSDTFLAETITKDPRFHYGILGSLVKMCHRWHKMFSSSPQQSAIIKHEIAELRTPLVLCPTGVLSALQRGCISNDSSWYERFIHEYIFNVLIPFQRMPDPLNLQSHLYPFFRRLLTGNNIDQDPHAELIKGQYCLNETWCRKFVINYRRYFLGAIVDHARQHLHSIIHVLVDRYNSICEDTENNYAQSMSVLDELKGILNQLTPDLASKVNGLSLGVEVEQMAFDHERSQLKKINFPHGDITVFHIIYFLINTGYITQAGLMALNVEYICDINNLLKNYPEEIQSNGHLLSLNYWFALIIIFKKNKIVIDKFLEHFDISNLSFDSLGKYIESEIIDILIGFPEENYRKQEILHLIDMVIKERGGEKILSIELRFLYALHYSKDPQVILDDIKSISRFFVEEIPSESGNSFIISYDVNIMHSFFMRLFQHHLNMNYIHDDFFQRFLSFIMILDEDIQEDILRWYSKYFLKISLNHHLIKKDLGHIDIYKHNLIVAQLASFISQHPQLQQEIPWVISIIVESAKELVQSRICYLGRFLIDSKLDVFSSMNYYFQFLYELHKNIISDKKVCLFHFDYYIVIFNILFSHYYLCQDTMWLSIMKSNSAPDNVIVKTFLDTMHRIFHDSEIGFVNYLLQTYYDLDFDDRRAVVFSRMFVLSGIRSLANFKISSFQQFDKFLSMLSSILGVLFSYPMMNSYSFMYNDLFYVIRNVLYLYDINQNSYDRMIQYMNVFISDQNIRIDVIRLFLQAIPNFSSMTFSPFERAYSFNSGQVYTRVVSQDDEVFRFLKRHSQDPILIDQCKLAVAFIASSLKFNIFRSQMAISLKNSIVDIACYKTDFNKLSWSYSVVQLDLSGHISFENCSLLRCMIEVNHGSFELYFKNCSLENSVFVFVGGADECRTKMKLTFENCTISGLSIQSELFENHTISDLSIQFESYWVDLKLISCRTNNLQYDDSVRRWHGLFSQFRTSSGPMPSLG